MIRVDFIFSYWIVVWYILYVLSVTKYNPKFALIIGLLDNLAMLLVLWFFSTTENMIYFVIVNFLIKFIPYYTIRNTRIYTKDIYAFFVLFGIYILWIGANMWIYGNKIQVASIESLLQNKNETPGIAFLHWLSQKIRG